MTDTISEVQVVPPPQLSEVLLGFEVIRNKYATLTTSDNSDNAALRRRRENFALECFEVGEKIAALGEFALYLNYKDGLWRGVINAETGEPYANGMDYVMDFLERAGDARKQRSMFSRFSMYRLMEQIGVEENAMLSLVGTAPSNLGALLQEGVETDHAGNFVRIAADKRERIEEQMEQVAGHDRTELGGMSDKDVMAQFLEVLSEQDGQAISRVKAEIVRDVTVRMNWIPHTGVLQWTVRRGGKEPQRVFWKLVESPDNKAASKLPDVVGILRKLIDGRFLNVR